MAINRGHGSTTTLGTIKHGILIKLDNLDSIEVDAKANTATLGGGVYIDQVLAKLAEYGKVCCMITSAYRQEHMADLLQLADPADV